MEQTRKYDVHRKREQEKEQNGRGREAGIEEQISILLVRHACKIEKKTSKPPAAFELKKNRNKRHGKGTQEVDQPTNQQVHEQTRGSGAWSHSSRRIRMDQTEEAVRLTHLMQQWIESMFQQFWTKAQEGASGK